MHRSKSFDDYIARILPMIVAGIGLNDTYRR